jgi:hypothetical protein
MISSDVIFVVIECAEAAIFCHNLFFSSLGGFWIEEPGFLSYVRRVNIGPYESLSVALICHD